MTTKVPNGLLQSPGGGAVESVNGQTGVVVLGAASVGAQPVDAALTAIAGLATGADQLPFFTGTDTAAQTPLTVFARSLIDDANAATARATLVAQETLVSGTNIKTINGESLLASGNIVLGGYGGTLEVSNTGAYTSGTISISTPGTTIPLSNASFAIVTNTIAGASVSSDSATLPAGTYQVSARAPLSRADVTISAYYYIETVSGTAINKSFGSCRNVAPGTGSTIYTAAGATVFTLLATSTIKINVVSNVAAVTMVSQSGVGPQISVMITKVA